MRTRRFLLSLAAPVTAIVFSVLVASLVLLAVGLDPWFTFSEMGQFAASVPSVISIINRAVPLFVSGLAVAIGFKMGLFNIGVEGQYLIAALVAAWVGAQFSLPPVLHVTAIILTGAIVGSMWAGIAGALKVTRGVSEVISTIMLNFIAIGLTAWLLASFLRERVEGDLNIKTPLIPETGWLPGLNVVFERLGFAVPGGSELQGFLLVAILLGIGYYVLVWKTRFGFELRASGLNPGAARMAGVKPGRMVMYTMLISGALAGLVAMGPLLGFFHQYTSTFPIQLGFTGIAVALLGRNHPVGIAFGALLFGFMDRSAQILDLRGVPKEIVVIIQGIVVLAVVVAYEVVTRVIQAQQVKAAAEAMEAGDDQLAEATA